ncbi:MAG TPA: leucyl aminopeptidase [Jatrophihabitans sp.]
MTSVSLANSATALTADAIVIGTVSTDDGIALAAGAAAVDKALGGTLLGALKAVEASGKQDEVVKIPTLGQLKGGTAPLIVATGLGKADPAKLDAEAVRRGVGAALRSLNAAKRIVVAIGSGTDEVLVGAISDGALLGAYRFTRYKSQAKPPALKRVDIAVSKPTDTGARSAIRRSRIITEAVNNTRDLVNMPANDLNPPSFADYAAKRGKDAGLTVQVLDEKALERGGFGGILAVGRGSATPPRLVRLTYKPARPKAKIALVGKGITFDTGGLNLKLSMMALMKSDMGGAAAVIEAVAAAAALRLPVEVTATVPMAENAVGGSSYRPSDVLKMRDGRTVEVADTDAEGRLILADAMLRAGEDSPDYLIETSTLTGGQMVALGTETSGAMGTDEFRDLVVAAGNRAGESLWPMPLPDHLRPWLDSPVADIANLPKERWGSMLVAGVFLSDFVGPGLPWVHLDIAGPSFASAASGYTPKGGTGVIVRTILATLTELGAS